MGKVRKGGDGHVRARTGIEEERADTPVLVKGRRINDKREQPKKNQKTKKFPKYNTPITKEETTFSPGDLTQGGR